MQVCMLLCRHITPIGGGGGGGGRRRSSSVVRASDSWSKGRRFESQQGRRENFLRRQGQLFVLTLISVSVHPCVTAVTHKKSRHSAKSAGGRLQLKTHTRYACGFDWSDTVNLRMVVWCTQNVRRNGSSCMWHQPCNNQTALLIFGWYSKRSTENHSLGTTRGKGAVSLLVTRE